MDIRAELIERSGGVCELCLAKSELTQEAVEPTKSRGGDDYVYVCITCSSQIQDPKEMDPNHWRCLNEAIWSEVAAVKVVAFRVLSQLKDEGWTNDLLEMMYLEDEVKDWAKAGLLIDGASKLVHRDSNGVTLSTGDNVVLIKDLVVKGANFTAKRGTAVRGISLVHDNEDQIEGRVSGQHIVILTQFVKKS